MEGVLTDFLQGLLLKGQRYELVFIYILSFVSILPSLSHGTLLPMFFFLLFFVCFLFFLYVLN